jgi:hypothetical protein
MTRRTFREERCCANRLGGNGIRLLRSGRRPVGREKRGCKAWRIDIETFSVRSKTSVLAACHERLARTVARPTVSHFGQELSYMSFCYLFCSLSGSWLNAQPASHGLSQLPSQDLLPPPGEYSHHTLIFVSTFAVYSHVSTQSVLCIFCPSQIVSKSKA